ncbi:NAD(P)-dependent dehydrogenase, short-chain alcohol dehydrogenase family [Marinobacter segnicrescens]|uniref:NAD(P)-dependent dehydrogenase, short-chain alcohol dehydrogenase family n=1 Tax=Marinobacter segnicrescens TaxID=430453 RepID=A0A1I0HSZ2_9GAMM|nr:glucose 1-dehydrogenase [Marinobacter segnicrescens]SET87210.1 NAD(P)-dependent dehydrogenase, short-chain alcohol dehydrogenase family [Marinobacter segnicrescens]
MTAQLPPELASAFSLEGKVALVTGSTMGIGEATARVLAQAGAHVIISSRKQDECDAIAAGFREQGLSAEGRACHIGRMEDIEAMSAWLKEEHGGLDILVNNAVLSPWRTIEDTEVGLFTKTVEVDLRGYWFMSVEAVKLMRLKGGGSIVNLASVAALHPDRMLSLYSTLKTALIGMSRSFALEFGGEGIRVNTVLPGVIQTKLADAFDADTKKRIVEKTTVKRLGEPEDIGYSVLYLCSNAGAYVSGTNLVVDGGFSVALM